MRWIAFLVAAAVAVGGCGGVSLNSAPKEAAGSIIHRLGDKVKHISCKQQGVGFTCAVVGRSGRRYSCSLSLKATSGKGVDGSCHRRGHH